MVFWLIPNPIIIYVLLLLLNLIITYVIIRYYNGLKYTI